MPVISTKSISCGHASRLTTGRWKRFFSALFRQFFQGLAVTGLAVVSYLVISHFFLQSVRIVGSSMVPTLYNSQNYLLNRWIYYVRKPSYSDVIVLRDPVDHGFSVKRVVAVAGDSVFLQEGRVYVNGKKLNEPYLAPNTLTYTYTLYKHELFVCGKNQYFVLGDNRKCSVDSRNYGPVPRQNILGLVIH